jgi:hypothetical protein
MTYSDYARAPVPLFRSRFAAMLGTELRCGSIDGQLDNRIPPAARYASVVVIDRGAAGAAQPRRLRFDLGPTAAA